MDPLSILPLIGIDEETIEKVDFDIDTSGVITSIYIELKDIRTKCPHCFNKNIYVKEKYERKIRHSVLKNKKLMLYVTIRRYKCLKCEKTFTQSIPFVEHNRTLSNETIGLILDDLQNKLTFKEIARMNNISIATVSNILDKDVPFQKRKRLSKVLCIDEFCFKHKGSNLKGKYPVVISDGLTGEILDIIESRRMDYLDEYFKNISISERNEVKFLVSDMYDAYETIRKKYFKNARHIVDMFHVVKAFNEVITKIRIKLLKQEDYKSKEYLYLKKNWKIFLMNRNRLANMKKVLKNGVTYYLIDSVDTVLKKYPDLQRVYWDKVEFLRYGKTLLYYSDAEKHVNFFIDKFQNSLIEEQVVLGKTLLKWKINIIQALTRNEYETRLTNSRAEANNNVIQTYIDLCYGCSNFERLRKRILFMIRSKK